MGWSEDRLHRWLARRARPRGLDGSVGHDAAVLRPARGRAVVCTDACVEGVHVEPDVDPRLFGAKAANRALSDLAASAARPVAIVLSVTAPRERSEAWLRRAIEGADAAARACGAELVGGDLTAAPGTARLVVTALGSLVSRRTAPGRDRARAGQVVVLTGAVGGSLLGRHLRFTPRVDAGRALHAAGATALMDVSDGLAWDLHRLARAAGVRIELDLARVPIHRDAHRRARASGRDALDHALHDGEDHELIATLSARAFARVRRAVAGATVVGRVASGRGLVLVAADGARRVWNPRDGGYRHGDGSDDAPARVPVHES